MSKKNKKAFRFVNDKTYEICKISNQESYYYSQIKKQFLDSIVSMNKN